MPLAADYPFLEIALTIAGFFVLMAGLCLVFIVIADVLTRRDLSGWAKAAWTLGIVVVPLAGVLVYVGVHGKAMGRHHLHSLEAGLTRGSSMGDRAIGETDYARLKTGIPH